MGGLCSLPSAPGRVLWPTYLPTASRSPAPNLGRSDLTNFDLANAVVQHHVIFTTVAQPLF